MHPPRPVWCVETHHRFDSINEAARIVKCRPSGIREAALRHGAFRNFHWSFDEPTPGAKLLPRRYQAPKRPVWNVETGEKFPSLYAAAKSAECDESSIHTALNRGTRAGNTYWSRAEPTKDLQIIASMLPRIVQFIRAGEIPAEIRKALLASLMLLAICLPCRASITYDVSIDTSALPAGQYQAEFYLSNLTDNWTRATQPDGFSIDGDLIRNVNTRYYADQPVADFAPPIPLNFNLTLTGSAGSDDYFLMAIRKPDGMLAAPDGSQWLAWAKMDADSPTLNLDFPSDASISAVSVPEPSLILPLIMAATPLLNRRILRGDRS